MTLYIWTDVERADNALARLRIVITVRRASPLRIELEVLHILVGYFQVCEEQIIMLANIPPTSETPRRLTPCSDDPAMGWRGGRNETSRCEKEKIKEYHCYCMMFGRVVNECGPWESICLWTVCERQHTGIASSSLSWISTGNQFHFEVV